MTSSTSKEHLEQLEAENIYIVREVAAQFERPALPSSGGRDSITLVHLAIRAFASMKIPFPLVHIDTGHNLPEVLQYRDALVKRIGTELIARQVENTIKAKELTEPKSKFASHSWLQTHTLLDTIEEFHFDACIGGARHDEERARAKERFFSVRDEFGQWDPKLRRPELQGIYNGRIREDGNIHVFPISNWAGLDVWNYIEQESIELPSIYFAHDREVIEHEDRLIAVFPFIQINKSDTILTKCIRYRTVGGTTCTAAVKNNAATLQEVISEIAASRISERGEAHIDDKVTEAAMKDRRKGEYF